MRAGHTLLEVVVAIAILAIVAVLPVLRVARPPAVDEPSIMLRDCQRRAVESRENTVIRHGSQYVVCRPDGRLAGEEIDSLILLF
jgi:prepilin-type N-terminal cleavage/methylation domain-containing protein